MYAFQLRVAGAVGVERRTSGVLHRLATAHLGDRDPAVLVAPSTAHVRVVDPTSHAVAVARAKARLGCNLLAAEVVAVAEAEGADVRLVPGNARGHLRQALEEAGVPAAVWELEARGSKLAATVAPLA